MNVDQSLTVTVISKRAHTMATSDWHNHIDTQHAFIWVDSMTTFYTCVVRICARNQVRTNNIDKL